MRVRAAHENRIGLAMQVDVVGEAAFADQKARRFELADRLAQPEQAHAPSPLDLRMPACGMLSSFAVFETWRSSLISRRAD